MSDREPQRILFLVHLPPPIHGVTVINEAIVNSQILRDRFQLDIIPLRFATRFSDIGSLRPTKFLKMTSVALRLASRLAFSRPDAVYMSLTPTGISFVRDALFVSLINVFGIRKIFHLHGTGVQSALERSLFNRLIYRWVFRRAHVIHLSERLLPDIAGVVPAERIHIVPNGIAAPGGGVAPRSDRPTLLYLSNITRLKGIFVLLDALKILSADGLEFRVDFAGAPADQKTLQEFRNISEEPALRGRLHYVGVVTGTAKDRLFRDADIFVMPTLFEAFGLVALEAMACALPVVCSDEGSLRDIVRDGETGLLVPKGDAPALAAALKPLILDANMRRNMGQAGLRRYRSKFTPEKFQTNLAAALERCIAFGRKV